MINEAYWNEYYKFWDEFVKNWFEQRPNEPTDEVSQAYKRCVKGLEFDELPEPYYGTPKNGVKAVILNLNPGILRCDEHGMSLEKQKFYSCRDTYSSNGPFVRTSLIKEFSDDCNRRYSEFARKWSCLNSNYRQRNTDLCGVKWWQGTNPTRIGGKRMPWLQRIYQNNNINPEEVLALELCPYHSEGFGFNGQDRHARTKLISFIREHVIIPAATAVVESELPFAVAVGKTIAEMLDSGVGTFREEWSYDRTVNWPHDDRRRTYRLYDILDCDGRTAQIVVTWAVRNRGIPAPGRAFMGIEKQIYDMSCGTAVNRGSGRVVLKLSQTPSDSLFTQQTAVHVTTSSKSPRGKKQNYNMLWNGFYNWCRENDKRWLTESIDSTYNKNNLDPSGGGNPHLFFRVGRDDKLYLGIYSNMREMIMRECQQELDSLGNVDWSFGRDGQRMTSILISINDDWRNPNVILFRKMADLFERGIEVLSRHGFKLRNSRA